MIETGMVILVLIGLVVLMALAQVYRLGIGFRQALFYLPMKLIWRIGDRGIRVARAADAPVIYAVAHHSAADPALMLSLLPDDTLHILDEASAGSSWLEPYRSLARTITFRPEHVFVSRRLVRHLKGKGRLAVYFPQTVEPDQKSFRLFRAVARIATAAGADVVAIHVDGSRFLPSSRFTPAEAPRLWLPRMVIGVLEPIALDALPNRGGRPPSNATNALFDRLAEARVIAAGRPRSLFSAFSKAARRFGDGRIAVEDATSGPLTHRQMMTAGRVIGGRVARVAAGGETVGLMLPSSVAMATSFIGVQSAGCAAAMINFSAGPASITQAVRMTGLRTIVSSKTFVEKAQLGDLVAAADKAGARFLWLEDIRATPSRLEKVSAALLWRWPLTRADPMQTAVVLFTSGSEGTPKGVLLSHANIQSNIAQVMARLALTPSDTVLSALPAFHSFGLTGGVVVPLTRGLKLHLYPSPLHYRQIPETAARVRPSIMFGTDTFLAAYARHADDGDFSSLRMLVSGAEPVLPETRRVWRERFGIEILEGYGLTEASPVVAVNTRSHAREGTVGRLLPGIRARLEPVDGIEDGGRLWISGPNVMRGYIAASGGPAIDRPPDGWHDTGDVVAFDRDGYLVVKGRIRRFAKIAGEMVSLGAVEAMAQALWPDASHAAVAVPDAKRGERVVLLTTRANPEKAELRAFAKAAGTAELAVPETLLVVEAIPILGTGKTDYPAVKALALARLDATARA